MGIFKKLGPHYAIERFGVMFIALVLCMSVLVGMITNTEIQRHRVALGGRAIYTGSFTMSQTRTSCSVSGLFVDSSHTKCLVLLHFNDMSMISSDAEDYDLSIAAVDSNMRYEEIKSRPAGVFYMFGSSGYAAIYLQDMSGFPSQILGVCITAKSKLTIGGTGESDTGYLYFNPGGAYATKAAFLDQREWKFFEMVEEVTSRSAERACRQELRSDLEGMLQQLILINEYRDRLTTMGITVPVTPAYVEDEIYAIPTEELSTTKLADCTKLLLEDYDTTKGGWLNSAGDRGWYNDKVTLFLDARAVVPSGHDFTWQTGRILTGYLRYLTGTTDVLVWRNYMNQKLNAYNPNLLAFETEVSQFQWIRYGDGSTFKVLREDSPDLIYYSDGDREINKMINLLKTAWTDYYNLKVKYETVDLPKLLQLEIDANDMLTMYTLHTNCITIY